MTSFLNCNFGWAMDQLLCGFLALLHRRHAERVSSRAAAEQYFTDCEGQTRAQHFAPPSELDDFREEAPNLISWQSPTLSVATFPTNGRARVRLFRVNQEARTIVILHALMSASDLGYRRWARRFNSLGWNVAF